MTRVKRGIISLKRRRKILSQTKGYRFARSKKERAAKEAIFHAGKHAFAHRRDKKADMRKLWQIRINAKAREYGLPYNQLINFLKKKSVELDRKILANLAKDNPQIFERIIDQIKN